MDKPIKVLLVENDIAEARLILNILKEVEDVQLDVEWADCLSKGLKCLATESMDVVLLDLSLPDSWGSDSFAKIHAQDPQVPIILLTDVEDKTLGVKTVSAGVQGYLVKGEVNRNLLVNTMRYAIDRKRSEELLRQSEEKYRQLFEESKDVIFISTFEGRFEDINHAGVELFGYSSKEDLLEIDIARDLYLNPGDRETFQRMIAKQGFLKDYELVLKRKDGRQVIGAVTANVRYDDQGSIAGYGVIMRDITEQKMLEQQFLQTQKMESLGNLAGIIAHDFNNLLGIILGYASFLKMKLPQSDPFFNDIDTIERTARRATELTARLLKFARGGKHNIKLVNLNNIVNESLRIMRKTFDKSIEFEPHLFAPTPTIEGDAGQMQQVIMNLCVNARDAMPGGGKLIIETNLEINNQDYVKIPIQAKGCSYVTLSVIDTGLGMDKQTLERMFEPFFTTKEKAKGTGLGLSMVYSIVKDHGGYVRVYSEPGKGSTFKIYLPVSKKPVMQDSSKHQTPLLGKELILIVDDEEMIRSLGKKILETHGYRVLLAENSEEAIEIYRVRKDEIGLLILDVIMPKMGAYEVFLKMKVLNPDVKILLSSGLSHNAEIQEILYNGVTEFIQKPYQVNELLYKVRNMLDARA